LMTTPITSAVPSTTSSPNPATSAFNPRKLSVRA
jgi:hypothetical protein